MGKRRKTNKHLPERMYLKSGSYYFVDHLNKWHNLGRDYLKAIAKYAEIRGPDKPITTMADLIDRYMLEVSPTKAESTYKTELYAVKFLKAGFGKLRPDDITQQTVYRYMDYRANRSKSLANREVAVLSHMFKKAIRWGVADSNPCVGVERYKEKPRDRYVTDEEFNAFRDYAGPLIATYMDFKYLTGLRRKDILELKREHLTEEGIHITTSKTGKKIIIAWSDSLHAVVERAKRLHCTNPNTVRFSRYLFCTQKGTPYTGSGFASIWQRKMRAALESGVLNERFREHDIRAKTGSDSKTISAASSLLTHENERITQRSYRRKTPIVKPLK